MLPSGIFLPDSLFLGLVASSLILDDYIDQSAIGSNSSILWFGRLDQFLDLATQFSRALKTTESK